MENLQPKLRFPEFKDNWEKKKLGDIGQIVSGLTYSPKDVVDEGLLVLRSSNIQDNKLSFKDNVFVNVKKYNPVEADDILICVRNGSKNLIGKNALITHNEEGFAFGAFMTIYRSKANKYIFQWMQHSTYREYVNKNLGATINSINGNDLKKFVLSFPTLQEQTKIADFLGAVDKQLDILNQKKEKLNLYKKGVMQQLFSQQIRFKNENGNPFPDWQEKKINDVFTFKQGVQCELNQQYLIRNENQYRFIRIIDLTNENEPPRYIYHENKNDIIQESDLFMVRYGSPGMVGYGYRGIIANNLFRLIPNQKVNTLFYKYQFNFLYKEIISLSSSTSMPAISFKSLNNLKVVNPSLEEQTKIANFLSAIDNQIETVEKQITQTETYKKGLLQQMFV